MDSIITTFLLFIAAIVSLLSYLIIPRVPVVALITGSTIALAAGVWWHWTQFSVDYRISTWQEQLRNYASFVMVLLVILLSYGVYAVGFSGTSPVQTVRPNISMPTFLSVAVTEEDDENEEEEDNYVPLQPAVLPTLAANTPVEQEDSLFSMMKNFNPLQ